MKSKKLILYFFVVTAFLMFVMPTINFFSFVHKNGFSKIKEIKKETFLNTDTIESIVNLVAYRYFNLSLVPNKVVTGKDNFLYLGNDYNEILNKTNGNYRPTKKELKAWIDTLKKLQNWYEKKDIKFLVVVAPNKHSVYAEKLPEWMYYEGRTITDDIIKLSNNKNINILDLRSALIDAKQFGKPMYNKYGTHWNKFGASIGYVKTIEYLNDALNMNLKKVNFKILDNPKGNDRGLLRFLKIDDKIKQYENEYAYDLNDKICIGNINKMTGELLPCKVISNRSMGVNNRPKYIINDNAVNNYNLLFICDSFGIAPSELYNASFKSVFKWHHAHLRGNKLVKFINKNKPDLVIYQIVERALYNKHILEVITRTKE